MTPNPRSRVRTRLRPVTLGAAAVLLAAHFGALAHAQAAQGVTIRAAYGYDYMPATHVDLLAQAGFNRLLVHWIPDSLDSAGAAHLRDLVDRGSVRGVEIVPEWLLQQRARLAARPLSRRYTWGRARVETDVACPLDSLYWRSALLDRAEEWLTADARIRHLAVDLELLGAGRSHYNGGPCCCSSCIAEYAHGRQEILRRDPAELSGLMPYEESRIAAMLRGLLTEFMTRYPGVELGVLDLDLDSFVHRAFARALARRRTPTVDYTESTYSTGAASLGAARTRLDRLGLRGVPLIAGLWLKRFNPSRLSAEVRGLNRARNGYFVFTTYSLWQSPALLKGPYTLQGAPGDYWRALGEANTSP